MYISMRAQQLRNILVGISSGCITLIVLLIAPLGLAAVIINTLLVTVATYALSSVADWVITWLLPDSRAELLSESKQKQNSLWHSKNFVLNGRRRRL